MQGQPDARCLALHSCLHCVFPRTMHHAKAHRKLNNSCRGRIEPQQNLGGLLWARDACMATTSNLPYKHSFPRTGLAHHLKRPVERLLLSRSFLICRAKPTRVDTPCGAMRVKTTFSNGEHHVRGCTRHGAVCSMRLKVSAAAASSPKTNSPPCSVLCS